MATCAQAARSSVATEPMPRPMPRQARSLARAAQPSRSSGTLRAPGRLRRRLLHGVRGRRPVVSGSARGTHLLVRCRCRGSSRGERHARHDERAAVFYGQRNLEWTFIKNTPSGLLWRTLPLHLLYSAAGVLHYIARGQGLAALKGKAAALAGLPRVVAKRRAVQDASRVDRAAIERQLTRGWIAVKRAEKDRSRL